MVIFYTATGLGLLFLLSVIFFVAVISHDIIKLTRTIAKINLKKLDNEPVPKEDSDELKKNIFSLIIDVIILII